MNTVPGKKNKNIKSNLVNQGKVILAAYGYKEMNLRALCQQAGVSTGAFYTRLAHKKELAVYIADLAFEELVEILKKYSCILVK